MLKEYRREGIAKHDEKGNQDKEGKTDLRKLESNEQLLDKLGDTTRSKQIEHQDYTFEGTHQDNDNDSLEESVKKEDKSTHIGRLLTKLKDEGKND